MALPRVDRVFERVYADDSISQRQISNVGLGASYNWIGIRSIADFAPELTMGDPPCQDFSSAGKRNENLGRANLTRAFTVNRPIPKTYQKHPSMDRCTVNFPT